MTRTAVATRQHPGDHYDEEVAALLRGYLASKRIRKRDLAQRIGQTDFWVGRRLNGQTPISVGELAVIADALGESIDSFLPAGSLLTARTRSSTDRASDYGSEVRPFARPGHPLRRRSDRRRRSRSIVPLHVRGEPAPERILRLLPPLEQIPA